MTCAVCNHPCNHLIIAIIVALTVTATAEIIRWRAQKMCPTLIIKLPFRSHRSNVAYRTVFYRCEIIRQFCTHPIINFIKRKVQMSWEQRWYVKHQHRCIKIWQLPTHHQCSRMQMDRRRRVANAWHIHQHRLDNCPA